MTTPREEGFRARQRGEPMTENPYPEWTEVHGQWNDGWREEAKRPVILPESQIAALCGIAGADIEELQPVYRGEDGKYYPSHREDF